MAVVRRFSLVFGFIVISNEDVGKKMEQNISNGTNGYLTIETDAVRSWGFGLWLEPRVYNLEKN
jgi:hypothetical protein